MPDWSIALNTGERSDKINLCTGIRKNVSGELASDSTPATIVKSVRFPDVRSPVRVTEGSETSRQGNPRYVVSPVTQTVTRTVTESSRAVASYSPAAPIMSLS
jgi:hypothetical protein